MPYAEDAEYIGTSAYFYVKQYNQARFFEPEPESVIRFKQLLDTAKECGYDGFHLQGQERRTVRSRH